jgi:transcription-repair coupling factor (superfamily II helicase)
LFCSNEAQAKRFHDIFESLDETNENIRKQYNTIVLPLYQGFIDEENQITCYTDHQILNAIINSIIKTAIRKTEYYFKRIDNVVCWRLCNTSITE